MQGFNIVNQKDKCLVLGCLNTALLLAENNIYNLQHKKAPLEPHQKTALARLQYEKNHIEQLKAKLLETMPQINTFLAIPHLPH